MEKIQIRIQQIWICVLDISCLSCGALGKLANLFEPSFIHIVSENWGFPSGSVVKNHPANAGDAEDANLIPRSGRSPGEANGNPLQYACLGNPMDRGTWQITVCGVARVRNDFEIKPPPQSTRIKWVFSPLSLLPFFFLSLSLTSTNSGIFYSVGFNSL